MWYLWNIVVADLYFCGTGKLKSLEGWWLEVPANPIFNVGTALVQRQLSHRCISVPGRCNAAILTAETADCAFQWSLVERNRANPPETSVLSRTSADSWTGSSAWKELSYGKVRFFSVMVNCQSIPWLVTPGCGVGMAPSGSWNSRRGFIAEDGISPTGLAVDQDGGSVLSVASYVRTATSAGVDMGGVVSGVAVGSDGTIYASLSDVHVVVSPSSVVAGTRGVPGSGVARLQGPTYLAVTKSGLVISDTGNHRVVHWEFGALEGTVVAGGTKGGALHQLDSPSGVAMDDKGDVYVCDYKNHRVMKWPYNATEGVLVGGLEQTGVPLTAPQGLALAADIYANPKADPNVIVADSGNHRIVVYQSPNRELPMVVSADVLDSRPTLAGPTAIAYDAASSILFAADLGNNRVVQYDLQRIPNAAHAACASDICCPAKCGERYTVSPEARFICDARGHWVPETPISCTPYVCDTFPHVATFTRWNQTVLRLAVDNTTRLDSGAHFDPECDGVSMGSFTCDRGEITRPFPWCLGQDIDIVYLVAVVAVVRGANDSNAFDNLGRPSGEIRYLARDGGSYVVVITSPRHINATELHPAYSLRYRLSILDAVVDTYIDWNFTFPYAPERNKTLIPPRPLPLDSPESNPGLGGEEHWVWFGLLQLGVAGVGCLLQPLAPRKLRQWRTTPDMVWRLWLVALIHVGLAVGLSYLCVIMRGNALGCAHSFNRARTAFESCQKFRITNFTSLCEGTWALPPSDRWFCFDLWPDTCVALEQCAGFRPPCGWATVALSLVSLSAGYFAPVVRCARKRRNKITPTSPTLTLGGFSVARAGQTNRLLRYKIELPHGVEGGAHVRFPLDVDGSNAHDIQLKGKFAQVQAPVCLQQGQSFNVLYDRENGQTEVSPKEQVRNVQYLDIPR